MTKERAYQIERAVFEYTESIRRMGNVDRDDIFKIGALIGRMRETLYRELMEEVKGEQTK